MALIFQLLQNSLQKYKNQNMKNRKKQSNNTKAKRGKTASYILYNCMQTKKLAGEIKNVFFMKF